MIGCTSWASSVPGTVRRNSRHWFWPSAYVVGMASPSRIVLSASATVTVALLVACGGNSAGGEDVDAFCEEYAQAQADGAAETEEDTAVIMADLERVGDLAPAEIRDDVDVLIDTFAEFMEIEAATETGEADEIGAAFELFSDPAFVAAGENVEQFAEDECGIEPLSDGDSSDDMDLDVDDDLGDITDDASGGDASGDDTVDRPASTIVTEAAPGDAATTVGELSVTELASWNRDQARLGSLVVTDLDALMIEQDGFDATLVAVDLDSGEIRTNPDAGRITELLQTETNGVFAFDFDTCTYRPIDPVDLSLGTGVGELVEENCSSGTDQSLVRGDVIWTVQPGALFTVDTTTGETRSLSPGEISDRFSDDDTPSASLLDIGDVVLVTYFESESGDDFDLTAFSTRVDDELVAGPLVEVPRLPRIDNGVLVDDATDTDGFPEVVVLDPLTLEVTTEEPPMQPMWGKVSCDPVSSLVAYPAPDGGVWVGPLAADGKIVVARCLDGQEVARGQIDHDQFSDAQAATDAFFYLATVRPEPDEDSMGAFEVIGETLVKISPS